MSSNTDTINNLANSIKNNPTAQKYMSRLDQGRAKMLKFINENKQKVILGTLATVIIVFYFVYIFRRIDRYLGRMDSAFGDISDVQPFI